jgi:hypothetical protein
MARWLTHCFIAVYLGALFVGIASHTVNYGTASHPGMYFLVWDMFCGWSAYDKRHQIIAEGESGNFYELAPAPWGEMKPYGNIGRRHYDPEGMHMPSYGIHVLNHTQHEPITRIIVVEESWAKKYNLPDELWYQQFDQPKDLQKYYHVRHVVSPEGAILQTFPSWMSRQHALSVSNNPRLRADKSRGSQFFVGGGGTHATGSLNSSGFGVPSENRRVGSLLGE